MAPPPSSRSIPMHPTTPFFVRARARVVGAVCVIALLLLAACGKSDGDAAKKDAAAKKGPPPAMPVTAIKVEPRRVPIALEAVGQAEGSRDIEIRARVSGILEKRSYAEGAPVKAGAVLFVIDPQPYEIAVAQ